MDITGSIALVTGAAGGLGRRFVEQLQQRGAAKVYAAGRDVSRLDIPGAHPLHVDLLDPASVEAAALAASDVTLLVNNAGLSTRADLLSGDLEAIRREMETNFFGTLAVTRAFAPSLLRAGGGVVNVLSALSFFSWPGASSYSASKAAELMLTNATRADLSAGGVQVLGAHLGAADTAMMEGYDGPLLDPAYVVTTILDALAGGASEVLLDDWSRMAKAGVAEDPAEFAARVAASMG